MKIPTEEYEALSLKEKLTVKEHQEYKARYKYITDEYGDIPFNYFILLSFKEIGQFGNEEYTSITLEPYVRKFRDALNREVIGRRWQRANRKIDLIAFPETLAYNPHYHCMVYVPPKRLGNFIVARICNEIWQQLNLSHPHNGKCVCQVASVKHLISNRDRYRALRYCLKRRGWEGKEVSTFPYIADWQEKH